MKMRYLVWATDYSYDIYAFVAYILLIFIYV